MAIDLVTGIVIIAFFTAIVIIREYLRGCPTKYKNKNALAYTDMNYAKVSIDFIEPVITSEIYR